MSRRKKKHAKKMPERAATEVWPEAEGPRPLHIDWSEPAEPVPRERYDIERDSVPDEIGPGEHGP